MATGSITGSSEIEQDRHNGSLVVFLSRPPSLLSGQPCSKLPLNTSNVRDPRWLNLTSALRWIAKLPLRCHRPCEVLGLSPKIVSEPIGPLLHRLSIRGRTR